MEAWGIWKIYPNADRTEVEDLIRRLAAELRIKPPPLLEDTVELPPDRGQVTAALDKVEPSWQGRGLIDPPTHPPRD